jgi:predicted transcriptional regulator
MSKRTITAEELQAWLSRWSLSSSDGAKVLRIEKSKISEYLSGTRSVPRYVAAHIDTFDRLAITRAIKIIQERLA